MAVQQFCLRWNNHQPNFISVFSNLLNSESLVDVTLAAEGRHLQAHKVVLSACSSYFQSLFMVNPCQHPIVILKDVKFIDLKVMVDFMYYGEVNVSQEQLPHILKTAEMLKIKGLAEMPDSTSLTKRDISKTQAEEWDDEKRKKLRKVDNVCVEEREQSAESVQLEQAQHMQLPPEIQQQQQQVVQQQPPPPPPTMETPMMEMSGGDPSTSQQGLPPTTPTVHHPGVQWTLVEQPYPLQTPNIPPPPIHYIHQYQPPPPATPETPNAAPASPCPSICPSTSPAPPSTPPKRKRSINPQADENFVRALEAVRFGGIGFCKAARMFGVNNRTLWLEYKKRGYVVTRPSIKNRVKVEKEDDGEQDGVPPPTPPPPQQQQHPQQVEFAPQQGFLGGVEFRGQPPPLGGQHINLGGGMHFN